MVLFDTYDFMREIDGSGFGYAIRCHNLTEINQCLHNLRDAFIMAGVVWHGNVRDELADFLDRIDDFEWIAFYYDMLTHDVRVCGYEEGDDIVEDDEDVDFADVIWQSILVPELDALKSFL